MSEATQNDRDVIRSWLAERHEEIRGDGALAGVTLIHYDALGRENELHKMTSNTKGWGDFDRMADVFDGMATRHARGIPGAQQMQLCAFYGANGKPLALLPFMRGGAMNFGTIPGGGLGTEAPTAMGQVQQGMRMGEMVVQASASKDKVLFDTMTSLIRDLRAVNLQLSEENRELFIALRKELIETVKLGHEQKMQAMKFIRESDERRKIFMLLPALVNATTGREVFPIATQDTAIVETLSAYCTEQEIRMFAEVLGQKSPHLSGLLLDRFDSVRRRHQSEQQENERVAQELIGIDPEADAAGQPVDKLSAIVRRHAATIPKVDGQQDASTHTKPTNSDTDLLDSLFATVAADEVDMLAAALSGKSPELAQRIKERAAKAKAKQQAPEAL